jgi:ADP-ribose pyrophosphatase YjhB (NUDIX family)
MTTPSIQTLTFLFDNKTDYILLHQIAEDGPHKGKHSGIKGEPGLLEDMNEAAIRTIQESTGLVVKDVVLRGVVKTIRHEIESAVIYFVFESARFSGELQSQIAGRMKWVDILHIFNLEMESLVQELMPKLLDGESFFEGTLHLNRLDEVIHSEIRICNSI